ncbi:MAG: tRNA-guanine transglycosylase, partial [Anaerolineaceae bacterium]|nr:tRNA-guanine transglycosylase [Anaerolineaceae bacterium]
EGSSRRLNLTPEKSIQIQFNLGSDLLICLDDCTHVDAPIEEQEISVDRTINWAKRCKVEFEHQLNSRKTNPENIPLLFAVIQGGGSFELRKQCTEALLEIGFDGFGFGGWPLDSEKNLLTDVLEYTRSVIPSRFLIHALGIGHPMNLVVCYKLGYDIFDCAMPTRDARHGRLYTFTNPQQINSSDDKWFKYLYINDEENIKTSLPISEFCDCPCCSHYSLGYLHHLHKMNDTQYIRLATLHNLRFMTQLTENITNAK